MENHIVDICVITYQRPELLERLLTSLLETGQLLKGKARIIVVDNDAAKTGEPIVNKINQSENTSIQYHVELEKGYSAARNKCLEVSKTEFIAFIDDDEWVTDTWLEHLFDKQQEHNATAVFGPVLPKLPENTPEWIVQGNFFDDRERFKDGERVKYGLSGNALINRRLAPEDEIHFDSTFSQSGGEDHELFSRLYADGHTLIWADKAVVWEEIIPEKLNLKWILKRAFRNGDTFAKVHRAHIGKFEAAIWYIKKLIHLFVSAFLTIPLLLKGKGHAIKMFARVVSNYSSLRTLFVK